MSKTNIPKKVIDLIKELELTREETLWDCHGTWVMYHKALEKIAAHKGVTFDEPKVIHSDVALKSVVMLVTGRMDQRTEWSFGEATPANNKNAYPFAMSEKRAKDRVILKLVGLHGDVYSDTEIDKQAQDDIKERATKEKKEPPKEKPSKTLEQTIQETEQDRKDIANGKYTPGEAEIDPDKIAEWEKIHQTYMKNISQLPSQSTCAYWFNKQKDVLKSMKTAVPRMYGEIEEHYTKKLQSLTN
jgi:hypothetical protein